MAVNSKDKSEPVEPLLESGAGRDVENLLVKSINFCIPKNGNDDKRRVRIGNFAFVDIHLCTNIPGGPGRSHTFPCTPNQSNIE